jgi:homoserine O-acetyltransferase
MMNPTHTQPGLAATFFLLASAFAAAGARAAETPAPVPTDVVLHDFRFRTGETLPELRMHVVTLGAPRRDAAGVVRNAVLILHGTTGSSAQFLQPAFAGELFGPGQPLDAGRYYLVIPDNIGHGRSSKPSDGLHARFPEYGYLDMVEAQYRMLTEGLHVNHLRLVMGTSMGGMHTWLWGELHPEFMDALMPLASLPMQIAGRNRVWRRIVIDAIRDCPDWDHGKYTRQPSGLRLAAEMLYFMGSNPVLRLKEAPTLAKADEALDRYAAAAMTRLDANDVLYAVAASRDYDPGPDLGKIEAPLLAVNSADDLINPPELGVLEREITRVKHGRAVVIPFSDQTVGHGSHIKAVLWERYLVELLRESERNWRVSGRGVHASRGFLDREQTVRGTRPGACTR